MHITIPGNTVGKKNANKVTCRGRFPQTYKTEAFKAWHAEASKHLQSSQERPGRTLGVGDIESIVVTFYRRTEAKYDASNMLQSIEDLLVDCGIIEDDNVFVLPDVRARHGGKDKANPRAEVVIHLNEQKNV